VFSMLKSADLVRIERRGQTIVSLNTSLAEEITAAVLGIFEPKTKPPAVRHAVKIKLTGVL
jgi:hypothetical protein